MAPRPKLHNWNDKEMTVAQLAKIRGCSPENMHHLIRKYGFPEAMNVPQRTVKVRTGNPARNYPHYQATKDPSKVKLQPFDKMLEKRRRWLGWLNRGMSMEEIRIKESLI